MSYNWEKIFKSKTDKELYEIFLGRKQLGAEAKEFAEVELKSRNFNFDNIDSHKKKWTLEKLIEEERNESGAYSLFRWTSNSKHSLMMAIGGAFLGLLMTFDYFFDFMTKTNGSKNQYEQIGFIIFFFAFSVFGLISYLRKRKHESQRKEKIKELISEMK
ncbi:MAG: hypothetical protein RBS07_03875 [Lentimicrobium sp.]|jgi:hypothetical protein|nr:hypothetical protein [Lentimicrobium sp.]